MPAGDALVRLERAVRRAVVVEREHGGRLLDLHFRDGDWAALVEVIRALEADCPQLHGQVGTEEELGSLITDAVAAAVEAKKPVLDIVSLGAAIQAQVAAAPDRWVMVPLGNVVAPDRVVVLDRDGSGQARAVLVPTLRKLADEAERRRAEGLRRQLAKATGVRGAWLQTRFTAGPSEVPQDGDTDSRVGALLVVRHGGPLRLSRYRALTEAHFAVALWCLADPPDEQYDGFALWPMVADWQPLPYLSVQPSTVPVGAKRRRDGAEYEYAEYHLPDDDERLTLPWRTLAAADMSRPARALLSGAWALYLALSVPSGMQLPDRVMHLVAAREALCAPPAGVKGNVRSRWDAVAGRFRLYERLAAEMDVSDAKLVEERIELVRNLAAHAGDAYSLLTGAPIDSTRRKNVPRDRLVPATTARSGATSNALT
jgi:hypothetical protein